MQSMYGCSLWCGTSQFEHRSPVETVGDERASSTDLAQVAGPLRKTSRPPIPEVACVRWRGSAIDVRIPGIAASRSGGGSRGCRP